MFIISLIGQKGGTGKTTVAVGLAVASFLSDKVAVVIDLDPQASAANWKDRRDEDNPAVVSAQASRLKQTLAAAEELGAEIVIIDTAGRNDDSALTAARMADLGVTTSSSQVSGISEHKGNDVGRRVFSSAIRGRITRLRRHP